MLLTLATTGAVAHSGTTDRWIERMASMSACSATVITVQVILCVVLVAWFHGSALDRRVAAAGEAAASRKLAAVAVLWAGLSFCLTPLAILAKFFDAWALPVLGWLVILVLCFFRAVRIRCTQASTLRWLIHACLQQAAGYAVYLAVYGMDFFRDIFRYSDSEYELYGLYLYPEAAGVVNCGDECLTTLLSLLIPAAIMAVSIPRDRKTAGARSDE